MELLKANLHRKPKKANEYRNNLIVGTKVAKLPRIGNVEGNFASSSFKNVVATESKHFENGSNVMSVVTTEFE
jgi:hypothetical protein